MCVVASMCLTAFLKGRYAAEFSGVAFLNRLRNEKAAAPSRIRHEHDVGQLEIVRTRSERVERDRQDQQFRHADSEERVALFQTTEARQFLTEHFASDQFRKLTERDRKVRADDRDSAESEDCAQRFAGREENMM